MRSLGILLTLTTVLVFAACGSAKKGPTGPPTAMQVIERFVEVTGGQKALESVLTLSAEGEFAMPSMGINGSITVHTESPSKALSLVEIPGAGTISRGVMDDVAWEVSVMTGPRIFEGMEASSSIRQADSMWFLHPDKHFSKVHYAGIEMIDEFECHRIELTAHDGATETQFYATDTGLLRRTDTVLELQMGEVASSAVIESYEEIEGILFPVKIIQSAMGMEQVISLTGIKINPSFQDGLFDLPDEIQALVTASGSPD